MLKPGAQPHSPNATITDDHHHGADDGAPYAGGPFVTLRRAAMAPAPPTGGPNDGDPPTGELCGSVFWTLLNQRLHRLHPDNETFVAEMERSVSVAGGAQGLGRRGAV